MAPDLFDAHAHLREVPKAGAGWIVPGVNAVEDENAPRSERIWRAAGLHPWHLDGLEGELDALTKRAKSEDIVAIGETGLDAMRRAGPRAIQERAFRHQIALAMEHRLPLILHVVRRHGACLKMLREQSFPKGLGGMVHDFGGPAEVISEWIDAGFKLSISPRSVGREDRAVWISRIPEDHLLVESDDFGPERLLDVVRWVAAARNTDMNRVAERTERNARQLFRI